MDRDRIPGSKCWKFDFHSHTPVLSCHGPATEPTARKAQTSRVGLLDFMSAGLDRAAVTDRDPAVRGSRESPEAQSVRKMRRGANV